MDPQTQAVTEVELLGEEPVRLPRLREAAEDVRWGARVLRHRAWWIALAIVLVVGAAGVVADAGQRSRDVAAVARCEHQLTLATGYAERRLGLVSNYLKPTLSPNGRVQQLHLADLMAARAGGVLPRIQRADRMCRGVSVSPWHFSLVERQSAASAYSAALLAVVQTVAAQGRVPFSDDATLQRLRAQVGIPGG